MCQHCDVPTCVSVCPVGAFTKTAAGPVLYDAEKCIGCRYCMQACPFRVPRYEWKSTRPRVQKCNFCYHRLAQGLQTACAEACPTGATKFGEPGRAAAGGRQADRRRARASTCPGSTGRRTWAGPRCSTSARCRSSSWASTSTWARRPCPS